MPEWIEVQRAWSGETLAPRKVAWATKNRDRLKRQFTPGEQAFCRIIDKMKSRLDSRAVKYLWYHREKPWHINSEIVFYGDFYFKAFKLLVEIDGDSHSGPAAKERDRWREQLIAVHRIETLRFTNEDVLSGDFRDVEQKFIESIARGVGMGPARRIVRESYRRMLLENLHIYGTK